MGKGQIQVVGHKRRCAFEHSTCAFEKEIVHGFVFPLCANDLPGQLKIPDMLDQHFACLWFSAAKIPRM
jgi:hypothetical protein